MPTRLAAPPNNLPLASSLPKVSFRRIPHSEALLLAAPAGVHDQQNVNYGFNDGSEFERPEHYLRYVEPIEADLKKQVEYDMDEQDQEWLDALNLARRKDQLDPVSYEVFEIIIDRLEKEWFDLMKRVPTKVRLKSGGGAGNGSDSDDEGEDSKCAICDDGECENSNAIVFCDGCNLAVHQDCYGIPYIPEGQWLCRKCTVSPDRAVSCILCPHEGGAFKQTTTGKWAHLLCAMWIPETGVSNPVYMEPVDSVERIPKARWKLQCYLCRHKTGACIQCDNRSCFTAFHVTCARQAGLLLKSTRQRASHGDEEEENDEVLKACCHKHLPKHLRVKKGEDGADDDENDSISARGSTPLVAPSIATSRSGGGSDPSLAADGTARPRIKVRGAGRSKSARAYKKSYRAGPPLVPSYVVSRVLEYIGKISIRKKAPLVMTIARFWSLKREARRGAPLLKRLHLEPWTASASSKEQTDAQKVKKLQFLLRLREDLEKIRMLAELVRKREREKLRQAQLLRSTVVDAVLFPYNGVLRNALERVSALDRSNIFLHPVSRQEVPDYFDIVKRPMDWTTISEKLDDHEYSNLQAFKDDIHLVLDNALLYNKQDTLFHRTAQRLRKSIEPVLAELDSLNNVHEASTSRSSAPPEDSHEVANDRVNEDMHAREEEELVKLGGLEPEEALLSLLGDYDDSALLDTIGDEEDAASAPSNIVEDLARQYYCIEPPAPPPGPKSKVKAKAKTKAASGPGAASTSAHKRKRSETDASIDALDRRVSRRLKGDEAPEVPVDALEMSPARQRRPAPQQRGPPGPGPEARPEESATAASARTETGLRVRAAMTSEIKGSEGVMDESGRKRYHTISSDLGEPMTLEVNEVDAWDSFKRFNVGWVLPEGTRRGGRPLRMADALPEPKKRVRKPSAATSTGPLSERSASSDPQQSKALTTTSHIHEDLSGEASAGTSNSTEAVKVDTEADNAKEATMRDADAQGHDQFGVEGSLAPPKLAKEEDVEMTGLEDSDEELSEEEEDDQEEEEGPTTGAASAVKQRPRKRGSHGQFIRDGDDPNTPRAPKGQGIRSRSSGSPAKSSSLSKRKSMPALSESRAQPGSKRRASAAATQPRADRRMDGEEDEVPVSSPLTTDTDSLDVDLDDDEAVGDMTAVQAKEEEDDEADVRGEEDEGGEADKAAAAEAEAEAARLKRNAQRRERHRQKRIEEIRLQQARKEELRRVREEKRARAGTSGGGADDGEEEENRSAASGNRERERERERDRGKVKVPPKPKAADALPEEGNPEDFEPGTLVWAKLVGYPFFPAETWDPEDTRTVPQEVLEMREEESGQAIHLVRFFDGSRSWGWMPTNRLRFLFENEELDQRMLKSRDHKTQHSRQSVRAGYARAKEVLED